MDAPLEPTLNRVPAGEVELSIREWPGEGSPFLLVHGLASNARTWDRVGRRLSAAGHRAIAVDQRGHGHSDKPNDGYDFAAVTADLSGLIESLGLEHPVIAGQSWGGNVVLEFAARYPDVPSGIVLVDGGFIDLASRPDATWESISHDLKPPNLLGTPRTVLVDWFRSAHAAWDDEQIEMQMGNYETLEDGTIRPWLTLERHLLILRALWEQRPDALAERVAAPVLVASAESPNPERAKHRDEEIARLVAKLRQAEVRHFHGAPHDVHIDRPEELADWMLEARQRGFFGA